MNRRNVLGVIIVLASLVSVAMPCGAQTEGKGSFFKRVMHACNDVDSNYCEDVPWKSSAEVRSSMEQEVLVVHTPDGLNMKMASELSYKLGPYFSYGPISVGYLFSLNPTGRRKNIDFSFSVNTNLFNVDFIYRRTGGEFNFRELSYPEDGGLMDFLVGQKLSEKLNNSTYNTVFGFNASWIPNHKKFSNKAASSYGSVQVKSAGSPILGFGYTFHKLESELSSAATSVGLLRILGEAGLEAYNNPDLKSPDGLTFKEEYEALISSDNDEEAFSRLKKMIGDFNGVFLDKKRSSLNRMMLNTIPTTTRVYDWHLQLGYAYNFVLSRHFMIGAQLVACPGIKHFTADNNESFGGVVAKDSKFTAKYLLPNGIDPSLNVDQTSVGLDVNARVSIRWYNRHWYAGATGIYNGYYYSKDDMTMNYRFWTVTASVGYNFNFKSLFKKKGHKD